MSRCLNPILGSCWNAFLSVVRLAKKTMSTHGRWCKRLPMMSIFSALYLMFCSSKIITHNLPKKNFSGLCLWMSCLLIFLAYRQSTWFYFTRTPALLVYTSAQPTKSHICSTVQTSLKKRYWKLYLRCMCTHNPVRIFRNTKKKVFYSQLAL